MIYVAVLQIPPFDSGDVPTVFLYDTPDKPKRFISGKTINGMKDKSTESLEAVLADAEKALEAMKARMGGPWRRDKLGTGKFVALVDGPTSL